MAVIEAIATTYLEADAASVTFSSLGSYEHLQIRGGAHTDAAGAGYNAFHIRFNGDTAANYAFHYMRGYNGSNTAATAATGYSYIFCGLEPGPGGLSTAYGTAIIDILDYRNTNKNTTMIGLTESVSSSDYLSFFSVLWDDTAAVTSILLYSPSSASFVADTTMTLYGLNSAN